MCCVTWLRLSTWGWSVVISGVRVACAIEIRVIACDGPLPPINLLPLVVHIIPAQPQNLSCLCSLIGTATPQQILAYRPPALSYQIGVDMQQPDDKCLHAAELSEHSSNPQRMPLMAAGSIDRSCRAVGEDGRRLEVVPDAILVLSIGTSVVDDDVSQGDDAGLLEGLKQGLQLLLAAVVAAQIIQLAWQVALWCAQA